MSKMLAEMTSQELDEWQTRESLQTEITSLAKRLDIGAEQATSLVQKKYLKS